MTQSQNYDFSQFKRVEIVDEHISSTDGEAETEEAVSTVSIPRRRKTKKVTAAWERVRIVVIVHIELTKISKAYMYIQGYCQRIRLLLWYSRPFANDSAITLVFPPLKCVSGQTESQYRCTCTCIIIYLLYVYNSV